MKINARYVNPFIEAAMRVLNQVAGVQLQRGSLTFKLKADPSYGICIVIGVQGFLAGQIIYSMEGALAERLADRMLGGRSPQEKKIMLSDTLGELANMITGNATALLNHREDQSLSITPPAIVTGERLSINLAPKPALVLGLFTPYGPIEISIALEEQDALSELDGLQREMERRIPIEEYRRTA